MRFENEHREATPEEIQDEERRSRRLRLVVDITCSVLMQSRLTREEAEDIVATARRCALELFPGKEETFDLILAPRFARLMDEFVGPRVPPDLKTRYPLAN
jgi:hypothetical protein